MNATPLPFVKFSHTQFVCPLAPADCSDGQPKEWSVSLITTLQLGEAGFDAPPMPVTSGHWPVATPGVAPLPPLFGETQSAALL